MWKSIKYLYFKLYKLFVKINGKDDMPEYKAMLGVGTLLFFNLLSVISIINLIIPIFSFPSISRGKFFIYVGIPYVLILYFTFIFKGKHRRIIKEFIDESEKDRQVGRRKVILYMLLSLIFVILSLSLIVMKNEGGI